MTKLPGFGISIFLACLMLCLLRTVYPKELPGKQVGIDTFEGANPDPELNPAPAKEASVGCSSEEECSRILNRVGRGKIPRMLSSCKFNSDHPVCNVFIGRKRQLNKGEQWYERSAPRSACNPKNPGCRFSGLKEFFKRSESEKDPELADGADSDDKKPCNPSHVDCRVGRKRSNIEYL